jgi:putative cardiolipin synthase
MLMVTASLLMMGCATIDLDLPRAVSHAFAYPEQTTLGRTFADRGKARPDESGFRVLESGADAGMARVALADAAERTLDLQYFIVQDDTTSAFLMRRVVSAAHRGVRVRILLDDLHGPNRDFAMAVTAADPRIELRLFNPFLQRNLLGHSRLFELLGDGERLNQRMHIKLWIADNAAAIFGGRNLGDEYFDAGVDTNFRDLDLMAVGPLVPQLSRIFDEYWNSRWSVPIASLREAVPKAEDELRALPSDETAVVGLGGTKFGEASAVENFRNAMLKADFPLYWAPGTVIYDRPAAPAVAPSHFTHIGPRARAILDAAQFEIILVSPYFVPSEQELLFLSEARGRGLRVAILTNSLASTDALAVHAGYARYRAKLLRMGVELFEVRPLAQTPHPPRWHRWVRSSELSLHAKLLIVDRNTAIVGSMNMDPRSRTYNTELLVVVESAALSSRLAAFFDEGVEPDHAFRVLLRNPQQDDEALVWITEDQSGEVRYDSEPLAGFWKRLWNGVLAIVVPERLL